MKKIAEGLYCRRSKFNIATSTAKAPTQLARQLIVGIFNKEAIMKCTLSGYPVRSLGHERMSEQTETLNKDAVDAIIGTCG